jgi:hypothetical protein
MDKALQVIAAFENTFEAEIARGRLESEGVLAFVHDAQTVAMNWTLSNAVGGVKLAVRTVDAERALEILGEPDIHDEIDSGWGSCPHCSSRKLEPRADRRLTAVTWLLLGVPLLFPRRSFYCSSCGRLSERAAS